MSDYNKLAVGYSNYGLNIAHDPKTLPFGKYSILNNCYTYFEGQLTARAGMFNLNMLGTQVAPIIGVRRLNDAVRSLATYIVRTSDGHVYYTATAGAVTTTSGFGFTSAATGFSTKFGSIVVDRTSRSNQIWSYVGDTAKMAKFGINGSATVDTKNVGITRPTGPPTLAQGAGGNLTLLATYNYRYTLYDNNTGVESLFNSVDTATITLTGGNQTVTVTVPTETVDPAVTHARIYRVGGSNAVWTLLGSVAYTGTTQNYTDTASDISVASASLLDTISDKPFTITNASGVDVAGQPLPYLFGPSNGYMLGCGDPQNPGYIYWCNKFDPDSQNPNNRVEVSSPHDPIMNGLVFDGKVYVFTKDSLYQLILGLGTSTWTPFVTGCAHGLAMNNAFCAGPEIYFLGKDGIYATGGSTERALTDDEMRPIFRGQSASILGHIYFPLDYTKDVRMDFHDNHLWFQYVGTDGNQYYLVWSAIYKRWYSMNFATFTGCVYDDEKSLDLLLFGGSDGNLYSWHGTQDAQGNAGLNANIAGQITTGLITLGSPLIHKEWGALIIDMNPSVTVHDGYQNVTITVYANRGTTQIAQAVFTDTTRIRGVISLGDYFSEDLIIDIQWASIGGPPIFYGYELLYRKDVVELIRWASRTTDLGIPGWKIVRSGYVTLNSNTATTLTITPDNGTTYTYSIPATGGVKTKVFIPFDPIKGKLFKFVLTGGTADETSSFRLYNSECNIHAKPWLTSTGYTDTNPFIGADGGQEVGAAQVGSNFQGNSNGEAVGQRSGAPWWAGGLDSGFLSFTGAGGTGAGTNLTTSPSSGTIDTGSAANTSTSSTEGNGGGGNELAGL